MLDSRQWPLSSALGVMEGSTDWPSRGKTISQLIRELQTFEDQELEVRISVNGGKTSVPISLVGKVYGFAMLSNCEDTPSILHHLVTK